MSFERTLGRDDNRVPIQDMVQIILGIPYVGNIFYVDPANGSDTANSGTRPSDAFATLTKAEDSMTSFNHDVVIIVPGSNAGTGESETITWDKSYCHLIGNTAPVHVSQRSRIVWTTDSVDPCITISGNGNIFKNLQFASYQASNDVLVNLTGSRNYFENVHFAGIGHETAGDDATARDVAINEGDENLFKDCTFGLDTVLRSAANANVELIGATASARNKFVDCLFNAVCDAATPVFVKFNGAYSSECYTWFKDCLFLNTRGGTTTMSAAIDSDVSLNGVVILDGCAVKGVTDWADDYTNIFGCNMADITASNSGFMEQIAT